jgi:hypothetical protein
MSEKKPKQSTRLVIIFTLVLMVTTLLITAGCLAPASKNTSATVPSTCSVDTGVCPVTITSSVRIEASPQMYSPTMSSTIGIGLIPNVSGFKTADAEFEWNATYGHFSDWSAPNYTISRLSQPVVNHGEKIFWSFTEEPASPLVPVIITVTARDVQSQKVLAGSRLTLGWKGNFTVVVEKIE